jgi:two-component system, response regulator YesN
MRIVIVEDEPRTRAGIVQLIGKMGGNYNVVGEAENGAEGMTLVEQLRPDLLIMDIQMPYVTGIEMLSELKKRGITQKTVILTGYSDFDYARRALQLGVVEYLEKPITAADLKNTLEKVEKDLAFQQLIGYHSSNKVLQVTQMLQRFLSGEAANEQALLDYLEEQFGFAQTEPFYVMTVYLGEAFPAVLAAAKEQVRQLMNAYKPAVYFCFELPEYQELIVCFQGGNLEFLHRPGTAGQYFRLLNNEQAEPVVSLGEITKFTELAAGLDKLRMERKWSVVLGSRDILSEQLIKAVKTAELQYPVQLEQKTRAIALSAKWGSIPVLIKEFQSEVTNQCYLPKQVMEACIRYISSLLNVMSEANPDGIFAASSNDLLLRLLQVQSSKELRGVFDAVCQQLTQLAQSQPEFYSMTVSKAIRMIQQQYQHGITLEEIAGHLHITPEYLSTLFNKEMKKSFTAYIKLLRINKAKELLLMTELKAYEVAKEIGYPDSAYFSRVFKDYTGMSPGEFQRLHK